MFWGNKKNHYFRVYRDNLNIFVFEIGYMLISDGSVVSFQKTAVAVLVLLAVFLKTAVAVVTTLTIAVAVII